MARVLIADDDEDIRMLIEMRLRREGHDVVPVAEIVAAWTGIPLGKMVKDEIKTVLPDREEHVVTTGEFARVHDRLKQLINRGRVEQADQEKDRPTLRRKTTGKIPDAGTTDGSASGSAGTGKSSGDTTSSGSTTGSGSDNPDGRPTLKRR